MLYNTKDTQKSNFDEVLLCCKKHTKQWQQKYFLTYKVRYETIHQEEKSNDIMLLNTKDTYKSNFG